jgi:glycine dehydrogenase subunit 2
LSRHDLLPDISKPGKTGCSLPELDVPPSELPPEDLLCNELELPEVTECELVRYFTALSKMNYGVDTGFYPLGSCTMKYNPKWHEDIPKLPGFASIHPLQPQQTVQGALRLMFELQEYLAEITGMDAATAIPMAGAHGELASQLMMKAYHHDRGDRGRRKILLTDSSHGTNPATSSMCGFEIGVVSTDSQGNVDMKSLNTLMNDEVAALTLTLPTTLGLFDPHIGEISELVHERGGLLWGDGANLNSLVGYVKFGDLGFDCMMVNLHKTFSTPHGGGGPGAGPVCIKQKLAEFLPTPLVAREGSRYKLIAPPKSIGRIGGFHGNFGVLLKAYAYIRSLGAEGLKQVAQDAVTNANYVKEKLKAYYHLPYDRTCMHEVIFSDKRQAAKGVHAMDIAKRLLDYGLHPPTVYFPLILDGALMIEPTETESKATLDDFIQAMIEIANDAEVNPDVLRSAPHNTLVRRLDSARAARQPDLRWEIAKTKTEE